MKEYTKRNGIIIGLLLIIIALMTIGYATLSEKELSSQENIDKSKKWLITIESVNKNNQLSSNDAIEISNPKIIGTSLVVDVEFKNSNSKIVYDIIVKNNGNFDALFKQISGIDELNKSEPKAITYTLERLGDDNSPVTGESTLLVGGTDQFRLTIENSSNQANNSITKTGVIYFDYEQK